MSCRRPRIPRVNGDEQAVAARSTEAQVTSALRMLRRRWVLLVLVTLAVLGGSLAWSLTREKQYDASADLLVSSSDPVLFQEQFGATEDPEREVANVVRLLRLETVAEEARGRVQGAPSAEELLDRVSTEVAPNTDVVTLTVRDEDPARAARLANAYLDAFVAFRRSSAERQVREAADLARNQYDALSPEQQQTQRGRELLNRAEELAIEASTKTGGVEVVRRAEPATNPSRPRPQLAAAVGLVLGLALALLIAVLAELVDRRLRDESDFEAAFGLPILSTVPQPTRRSSAPLQQEDPGQQEAYGTLAANVRYATLGQERSVIMITSGGPAEGKTSVTLELARGLARLGQTVVAIEADFRRPAFARYLALPPGGGSFDVLTRRAELDDMLVAINAETMDPAEDLAGVSAATVFEVLPAGQAIVTPQRVLAGPNFASMLEQVSKAFDIVLVDTAPVGAVNDALPLLELVQQTIVVARFTDTTRDQARRVRRLLDNFDPEVLGLVLTGTPTRGADYYGGYAYQLTEAEQRQAPSTARSAD